MSLPNNSIVEESYDEATAKHNDHIYDANCKLCNKKLLLQTEESIKEQVRTNYAFLFRLIVNFYI